MAGGGGGGGGGGRIRGSPAAIPRARSAAFQRGLGPCGDRSSSETSRTRRRRRRGVGVRRRQRRGCLNSGCVRSEDRREKKTAGKSANRAVPVVVDIDELVVVAVDLFSRRIWLIFAFWMRCSLLSSFFLSRLYVFEYHHHWRVRGDVHNDPQSCSCPSDNADKVGVVGNTLNRTLLPYVEAGKGDRVVEVGSAAPIACAVELPLVAHDS